MYLNRVELISFLGSEPEANFTPNGKSVTSLSLATKTSWMKGDERQERVQWHKIQVWGKLGEYAVALKKDAHIRVEGELRSREYETAGGTKVRTYEIVASSIHNLRPDLTPGALRGVSWPCAIAVGPRCHCHDCT